MAKFSLKDAHGVGNSTFQKLYGAQPMLTQILSVTYSMLARDDEGDQHVFHSNKNSFWFVLALI